MRMLFSFNLAVLVMLGVFQGCMPKLVTITPEHAFVKNYEIGQIKLASVGEEIIDITTANRVSVYTVAFDYQPPVLPIEKGPFVSKPKLQPLKKGMVFIVLGRMSDESGIVIGNKDYNTEWGIHIQPTGYVKEGWVHLDKQGPIKTYPDTKWTSEQLFVMSKEYVNQPGAFRAQVVYSGREPNIVKALYREYVNNLIRPAFTQELQYDLTESKTFAFRSISIEVIEATNSFIRYRVTSDNDLPWIRR